MNLATEDHPDLRAALQADLHGSLAHILVTKLSQQSRCFQTAGRTGGLVSKQTDFRELARLLTLAAHVLDTLAPRLRGRS
jgi:hypothetical protein